MCALGDHGSSSLNIVQADIRAGGNVDDNAACTGNAGFQQRAGDCSLGSVFCLACTLGNANAHVGKAGILHDGTDVSKVEVDESGNIDQAGDALNALAQHVIGCFKSVHQGDLFLADELQPLVRDHDQAVYMHHQVGNTLFGHAHLALALKGKGLGDNTNGQDAQVMGRFGHDRCSAGAGAAAHASGDEHHLGTFQCIGDLILAFLRCTLADLRVSTSAAALGQLCAKLNLLGSLGVDQCLLVGIHCYKFNAIQASFNHAVHSIAAAAANTDNLNVGYILHLFIENERHKCIPLKNIKLQMQQGRISASGHTDPHKGSAAPHPKLCLRALRCSQLFLRYRI